jgi:hypothetical protein
VVRGGTGAGQAAEDGRWVVSDRGGRVGVVDDRGVPTGGGVQGAEHRCGRAPHQHGLSLPLAMAQIATTGILCYADGRLPSA